MKPHIKHNGRGYDVNGELSKSNLYPKTQIMALYLWVMLKTDIPDFIIDDKRKAIECYMKRAARAKKLNKMIEGMKP